ncbi:MAG: purine-nucleoside phosphorylase [Saprospiraceae bacterium]|jgi:purine-nucleoside phosphorylase
MDIESYYQNIRTSAEYISNRIERPIPTKAIMMGTGLSSIVDEMVDIESIDYADIPNFPQSTVQSHKGKFVVGKLNDKEVLVLAGRWHYYEGYSTKELTFPIRVLKHLAVDTIIFTNVSGGVNESYNAGDLVIIKDHINAIPDHPLRGLNDDRLGPRFPDMLKTYSFPLRKKIKSVAAQLNIPIHEGVYYGLQGPSLETPAEYVMINKIGADLVGMSTVPEVIVAKHAGMKIAAVSIVSNVCFPPERITETTLAEVIHVANQASDKLNQILGVFVNEIT